MFTFLFKESPSNTYPLHGGMSQLDDKFNWTISYHSRSEFYLPHGGGYRLRGDTPGAMDHIKMFGVQAPGPDVNQIMQQKSRLEIRNVIIVHCLKVS